ncbi:DNA-formamidopyrimidine glycosylase family protein [Nocardia seriolae]|uniref:DNA-(apurinic or apyrimidinic site) lyase n=1 Tax=Nocardia seriolae TaxID=37332 RepID=A0A0B8NC28_9NOCA|nr:DNA-formamidopyrimidine glycosylase family protein [Nocardia seriolae]APB01334.1 Endonuclease 8 [Nocardia seriolae]MTJ61165.1 Fpg/Nei family DNA glycosylase [Nocardia seriolae]MTJ69922.1 Fpg/Nei family DNA glycosylase [Nocardia seriolae]MTJ90710.1 Fpg/Nei family DNA glycosylase [Nocardia seriolae]MTK34669.1 Fpg/Nei family DNA glycosylase [Nocardia seriolae]
MPEGDTVYLTAARLRKALAGKTLTRSDFRVPKYATIDLKGQEVESVGAYGKHLFIRTPDLSIHTHLKMEGEWRVYIPGQRWSRPAFTARLILANATAEAVGFSLGLVEVLRRRDEHTAVDHLGPDLLGPNWDAAEAVRRLSREPDRPIGLALLDQTNLAGIGNIYRSEVCFLRRIHPATPVGDIDDLPALVDEAHRVLTKAAHEHPWRALAYGRQRRPCRRCGTSLVVHLLGDDGDGTRADRGIYFCPRCQLGPNESIPGRLGSG